MMHILIIDDEQVRLPTLQAWARHIYGAATNIAYKQHIPRGFHGYDVIFLDHDLGKEGDVYDSLRNRNLDYFTGHVIVHSMNPVGAQNIARLFRNATVRVRPYSAIVKDMSI